VSTTAEPIPRERPEWLSGPTIKATCGCGNIYITVNSLDGKLFEVFVRCGKNGECTNTTLGAIGFIFSDMLQNGVPLENYARRLIGFECERKITMIEGKGEAVYSCVDAVAKTLLRYLESRSPSESRPAEQARESKDVRGKTCSQCGGMVVHEGGCDHCLTCGHSENCE